MRITHVIDYFHTDVGYQEYYLAKYQADLGHAVRVVSSENRHSSVAQRSPDESGGARALSDAGVEVVRLPSRQLGHDRSWINEMHQALDEFGPDVLHVHGPFGPTAVRAALFCNRHKVGLLVDNHLREDIAPGSTRPVARIAYRSYRTAFGRLLRDSVGTWVAVGPDEANFLASRLAIPTPSIELIPLGFDPDVFAFDAAARDRSREAAGWSGDVVVTMTGKIGRSKRPESVAAACEAQMRAQPVRLVFAGNVTAESLEDIRQAAPGLAEAGRLEVRTMLSRHELANLFLAADIAVFPRLPSISIQEAAGTGLLVLIAPDLYGRWLETKATTIRAGQLDSLLEHFDGRDRGELAADARTKLSWTTITDEFISCYRRIIE